MLQNTSMQEPATWNSNGYQMLMIARPHTRAKQPVSRLHYGLPSVQLLHSTTTTLGNRDEHALTSLGTSLSLPSPHPEWPYSMWPVIINQSGGGG